MSPPRVLIFGAGGHAKVVASIARARGLEVAGFLEDGDRRDGEAFCGAGVIAWARFASEASRWEGVPVAPAIGDNAGRADSVERLRRLGRPLATLIHPSAVVAPGVAVGEGTAIMPGAVVNPDARLGEGVIVNTGAVVEHDCWLDDFVHLSPNAALGGGVRIGARAHLGLGAVVLPRVSIGAGARVGAGAVVLGGVAPGATVVGVPARPLETSRKSPPAGCLEDPAP
jgi:sugar O-acyltransferase (sialic acid O-acetyltransferase NeuD family)